VVTIEESVQRRLVIHHINLSESEIKLRDAGYISITAPDQQKRRHITTSEKLKPFIVIENEDGCFIIKLGDLIIDEITGISEGPMMGTNTRIVEYIAHLEQNELGKLLKLPWGCNFNDKIGSHQIFKKYDDGWRVIVMAE
jgi:hypothetical protein